MRAPRTPSTATVVGSLVILAFMSGCARHTTATVSPLENGRLIFQTGKDSAGVQIAAQPPALYNRCAACHRANGAGGMRFPDGAVSADLRHAALAQGPHPYTLPLLERAISTGIDNDGKPLDKVMPRWRLSRRDLHDVALYVLTLK
jgi:mono/diheme cytochrome c family protein